jgi:hypothetical protein
MDGPANWKHVGRLERAEIDELLRSECLAETAVITISR